MVTGNIFSVSLYVSNRSGSRNFIFTLIIYATWLLYELTFLLDVKILDKFI